MKMKYVLTAAALIAASIATACAGGAGVTQSVVSTHASSYTGVGENVYPQSAGPSFVEIHGVDPEDQIASDGVGGEWFGNGLFQRGLVRFDETTHSFHEFPHPFHPIDVLGGGGADNKMWFASGDDGVIGDIDLQTHNIKIRTLRRSIVLSIAAGQDNQIYFTRPFRNDIVVLDPSTFAVHFYAARQPYIIALGSDGGLWFTIVGSPNSIGRIDPLSHAVTTYDLPSSEGFPRDLTSGPDGAIWFSIINGADRIGRLDIASHNFTFYNYAGDPCGPEDVVTMGAKIWFTTCGGVGKVTPSTGEVHLFSIPNHAQTDLIHIARGADDQLWATEANGAHRIWEVCPDLGPANCASHARQFTNRLEHIQLIAGTLVSVGSDRDSQ